jgi:BMFP domain-containing protein YqiC
LKTSWRPQVRQPKSGAGSWQFPRWRGQNDPKETSKLRGIISISCASHEKFIYINALGLLRCAAASAGLPCRTAAVRCSVRSRANGARGRPATKGPDRRLIPTDERAGERTLLDSFAQLVDSPLSPITVTFREPHPMFQSKALDDLAARIGAALENSPAKDVEKNVKAMLGAGLARLDLVPRAEFDVQAAVLLKTREKIDVLEQRLAALEARISPPGSET